MAIRARISAYRIKKIIRYFCADIEATKVAFLTGINRNTVNRYYGLFRQAIFERQTRELQELMSGEVEIDDCYFGPKRVKAPLETKRGRGTHRQPVFGILERDGRVYTEIIPDCKRKTLRPLIQGRVSPESIIYSDGWRGYDGLVDVGFNKHFRVNHKKKQYATGDRIHINGIEAFWSFTKRRLAKFNGVKKNFALHLKECEWRWRKPPRQLEKELMEMIHVG